MLPGLSAAMMMAGDETLRFIDGSVTANNFAPSQTIERPEVVKNGDLLIYVGFLASTSAPTLTGVPSGWVSRRSVSNANGVNVFVYTKVAGSSEPSSYTWTASGNSSALSAVLVYRKAEGPLVDVVGNFSAGTSASTSFAAPAITPTEPGTLISIFAIRVIASVDTPPAGMTSRVLTSHPSSPQSLAIFDLAYSPAGNTGTKSCVFSDSAAGRAIQLQIY